MQLPRWPVAGEREQELIAQVLASPQWGGFHEFIPAFEQQFATFQDCRYGISAANGTLTLEMMLECAGIGPGDEVIVPAISFISTATAVSRTGATVVFVDVEPYSFNMDLAAAARAITPETKAIIVVHFGGPMANMDRFTMLAAERNILLFEDAAHAHGSDWKGRRAGSFGLAGSFSFQNGKVMTAGEGGIVTTNDEEFATRLRAFANQGRRAGANFFFHYTLGSNFRLTALQAAVLIAQLERLPEQIALRQRNAAMLKTLTAGTPGLHLQAIPAGAENHCWYLFLGRINAEEYGEDRNAFHKRITSQGIPCTPFYPHPLYGNPLYQYGGCHVDPCPNAEACINDAFWLPHRVLMADDATIREIATALSDPQYRAATGTP